MITTKLTGSGFGDVVMVAATKFLGKITPVKFEDMLTDASQGTWVAHRGTIFHNRYHLFRSRLFHFCLVVAISSIKKRKWSKHSLIHTVMSLCVRHELTLSCVQFARCTAADCRGKSRARIHNSQVFHNRSGSQDTSKGQICGCW